MVVASTARRSLLSATHEPYSGTPIVSVQQRWGVRYPTPALQSMQTAVSCVPARGWYGENESLAKGASVTAHAHAQATAGDVEFTASAFPAKPLRVTQGDEERMTPLQAHHSSAYDRPEKKACWVHFAGVRNEQYPTPVPNTMATSGRAWWRRRTQLRPSLGNKLPVTGCLGCL